MGLVWCWLFGHRYINVPEYVYVVTGIWAVCERCHCEISVPKEKGHAKDE